MSPISKLLLKVNSSVAQGITDFSSKQFLSKSQCFWSPGPLLQNGRLQYANPCWNSMLVELRATAPKWASPISKPTLRFITSIEKPLQIYPSESSVLWPRCSFLVPRASVPGHRSSILGTWSLVLGPRSSILGPRSSILGPRPSVLDPRSSNESM